MNSPLPPVYIYNRETGVVTPASYRYARECEECYEERLRMAKRRADRANVVTESEGGNGD